MAAHEKRDPPEESRTGSHDGPPTKEPDAKAEGAVSRGGGRRKARGQRPQSGQRGSAQSATLRERREKGSRPSPSVHKGGKAPARRRFGRWFDVLAIVAAIVLGVILWLRWWGHRSLDRLAEIPRWGWCSIKLDRPTLDASLALGKKFMLSHQKEAGNFNYLYDWKERTLSAEDNDVRQAGVLWGLSLIYRDQPDPEVLAAIQKAFEFFWQHTRLGEHGGRCIAYPGTSRGSTGTVALVALAHIEVLRVAEGRIPPEKTAMYRGRLGSYLRHLSQARHPDGRWHSRYSNDQCVPGGDPSPYFDGEALLALVKAAKYLGRDELRPLVLEAADAGHRQNVELALQANADSDTTKGYYQWSSMAFYELATSGWGETERYGDWVLQQADWVIDVHHILWRTRNTAYAYEGIIHAYELARTRGEQDRARKYACVVDAGLEKLTSWQVGGPIPNSYLKGQALNDSLAVGGIQNHAREPGLRIDVTQHQMHALILARQYLYK